jgi:iron complex transport system ATP-binding protein
VHDPKALVLDEPATSLDLRATRELHQVLRKLARSGVSIVMVTHHLPDLIPEIGRVILLKQGCVFYDGPREKAVAPEMLARLFEMPAEAFADVRSFSL